MGFWIRGSGLGIGDKRSCVYVIDSPVLDWDTNILTHVCDDYIRVQSYACGMYVSMCVCVRA